MNKEQLIELITKEVMAALEQGVPRFGVLKNSLPDALVIGNPDMLPDIEKRKYNFFSLDNAVCIEDMERFDKVFVEKLTLTELADIALGRDDGNVQRTVLGALLSGREVAVLESALPHKKHALRAGGNLYQIYEEYVRKLKAMRVRFITGRSYFHAYAAGAKPDSGLPEGVINEAVAKIIVLNCGGDVIKIKRGSIITPSAYDVFNAAGKKTVIE